jgi:CHAD domain-containing protein
MRNNMKFNIPDGFKVPQLIRELADQFVIKKDRAVAERLAFYDTFDWRLFNKSLVLYASGNKLFLHKLAKIDILHRADISAFPVFTWNFPDGELKNRLAPIVKMRALLKLAEVNCRSTLYSILNKDEKTVARLVHEEIRSSRAKNAPVAATHIWLQPIKGYHKYARSLTKRLREAGLTKKLKEDLFLKVLEAANKKPGDYSAKIDIQLDPKMTSNEATKKVLRFLLGIIKINQTNLEKDLDTEFLHEFRVAIRRTRSVLGQVKAVFPKETTNRFKKELAYVGKLSNEMRDLDVYLLNEDIYHAMLPDSLHNDIDPLFDHLRRKRTRAFHNVVRSLKTKKYTKILADWEAFLNEPQQDSSTAPNAVIPIYDLARKRIFKIYRDIVKAGNSILDNAEDDMLHMLRIQCKKLRYMMDVFSSLFPRKKINVLIRQLKILQDNLGEFNDLCVQGEYLLNISSELPASQRQARKALVAIGSLVGVLDRERQQVKTAFAKTFIEFASPANRELFRQLFEPSDQRQST